MPTERQLQNYAALIVKMGVNIQKDQELLIRSPIECAPFARQIAEAGYAAGAREVTILWDDEKFSKIKYTHSPLEVFESVPDWIAESNNYYARRGAAFVSIAAQDPDLFQLVDSAKLDAATKASFQAFKPFYDILDVNGIAWNVVSVPTAAWAKKVYPDCEAVEAVEKLWQAILKTVRADLDDPVAAWERHHAYLNEKVAYLNERQFARLHFKASNGTDLTLELPEGHVWAGGAERTAHGVAFFPNMPTEEVFCLPHRERVDGTAVASMPLCYQGSLIENFSLTFQNGKVVSYQAAKGEEALKRLLETDEGASMLGEVALVPAGSPISRLRTLFYNTLFDENAACHLALGRAYASCIKGGLQMSKDELKAAGANDSMTHIDFMIGTEDMEITAVSKDGQETILFHQGRWAV
ncbi:aminopeptidase [Candidatus Soleaferrea massiliensis]|uniref:aminopeptidase n=1 Tax=Candidatus Soleaferrea massiliensis TaxID=1470354 RepID=UPI00058BA0EA|nr:aminopeptidase [Candidatus Soleaferrea massiliensis]